MRRFSAALDDFTKANALKPEVDTRLLMAQAHAALQQYDQALAAATEVLPLLTDAAEVRDCTALIDEMEKKMTESKAADQSNKRAHDNSAASGGGGSDEPAAKRPKAAPSDAKLSAANGEGGGGGAGEQSGALVRPCSG
jgi:hypothetical protein